MHLPFIFAPAAPYLAHDEVDAGMCGQGGEGVRLA